MKRSHLRPYQSSDLNKKVRREGENNFTNIVFFYFGEKNYEASDYNDNIFIS